MVPTAKIWVESKTFVYIFYYILLKNVRITIFSQSKFFLVFSKRKFHPFLKRKSVCLKTVYLSLKSNQIKIAVAIFHLSQKWLFFSKISGFFRPDFNVSLCSGHIVMLKTIKLFKLRTSNTHLKLGLDKIVKLFE